MQERLEEDGVSEVADGEEDAVSSGGVLDGDRRDLPDRGVEAEFFKVLRISTHIHTTTRPATQRPRPRTGTIAGREP